MSTDLGSSISFLESTNDPANAYFSFTVDETGEYGIIKANKEGLRLYAAELLKKSIELKQKQDGQPLFFDHQEWMVSDAGYDLIAGIDPLYQSRADIRRPTDQEHREKATYKYEHSRRSGCLFSIMLLVIGGFIYLVGHKAFANLHLWENIH